MGKYKVLKKLGQGSYGTVYLVQDSKDMQCYVMKKITVSGMSEAELSDCKKEIQILSILKHPNIVRYKRSFVRRGALCIVMEYADGGDLHARIRKMRQQGGHFEEDQILNWFTQACLGLKNVHDHKILHRDLKTQNIFLTESGEVRLGDFGISRVLKNTMDQANTLVGTPYYLSPEMVNGQPYDHRSDVWSIGVVLYEMLTLQHPFNADSLQMLALKIIQGNYPPIPKHYSREVEDLLAIVLQQDPKNRPNLSDVLRIPIIYERVKKFMPDHEIVKSVEAAGGIHKAGYGQEPDDDPLPPPDEEKDWNPPTQWAPPPKDDRKVEEERKSRKDIQNQVKAPRHRLSRDLSGDVPNHSRKLPPPPPSKSKDGPRRVLKPRRSKEVKSDVDEDEPDWEIGQDVTAADQSEPPSPSQQPKAGDNYAPEPSVAKNTQVEILRAYLEERLGSQTLSELLECLSSGTDDQEKQKTVAQLTQGHYGLLPIVHTLLYLSQS